MDGRQFDKISGRLDRLENLLQKIEHNGRASSEEVWHVSRKELGLEEKEPVTVHLRCNFIRVGDIDGVNQEFKAEIWIGARWRAPELRGQKQEEIIWEDQWSPRLTFHNAVTIEKQVNKHRLRESNAPDGVPHVILGMRVIATFKENLELDDFPFDYQKLSVDIWSDWPTTDVQLVKDKDIKDSINTKNFSGFQGWELVPHVQAEEHHAEEKEASASHRSYPKLSFSCHVKRRAGYFLWNIFLITGLIMVLTFASLAVEPTEPADRLSVTLTLLLTSVAFKFVVSQSLPTISYLTLLDTYVLGGLIFQCIMVAQNSIASTFPDVKSARRFDLICAAAMAGLVVIFHLIIFILIIVKVVKRNRLLKKAVGDYKKLCDDINQRWQKTKSQDTTDSKNLEVESEEQDELEEHNSYNKGHLELSTPPSKHRVTFGDRPELTSDKSLGEKLGYLGFGSAYGKSMQSRDKLAIGQNRISRDLETSLSASPRAPRDLHTSVGSSPKMSRDLHSSLGTSPRVSRDSNVNNDFRRSLEEDKYNSREADYGSVSCFNRHNQVGAAESPYKQNSLSGGSAYHSSHNKYNEQYTEDHVVDGKYGYGSGSKIGHRDEEKYAESLKSLQGKTGGSNPSTPRGQFTFGGRVAQLQQAEEEDGEDTDDSNFSLFDKDKSDVPKGKAYQYTNEQDSEEGPNYRERPRSRRSYRSEEESEESESERDIRSHRDYGRNVGYGRRY